MTTLIASLVFFCGCLKDDANGGQNGNGTVDNVPPVVQINSPVSNQQFNVGETITVSGRATDDKELRTGIVRYYDGAGMLVDAQPFSFSSSAVYNFMTVYTPTAPTTLSISVSFSDAAGNVTNQVTAVIVH